MAPTPQSTSAVLSASITGKENNPGEGVSVLVFFVNGKKVIFSRSPKFPLKTKSILSKNEFLAFFSLRPFSKKVLNIDEREIVFKSMCVP